MRCEPLAAPNYAAAPKKSAETGSRQVPRFGFYISQKFAGQAGLPLCLSWRPFKINFFLLFLALGLRCFCFFILGFEPASEASCLEAP